MIHETLGDKDVADFYCREYVKASKREGIYLRALKKILANKHTDFETIAEAAIEAGRKIK